MAYTRTSRLKKFLTLKQDLRISGPKLLGFLEWLWQWAHEWSDREAVDYLGPRFETGEVEAVIEWDGEPGAFEAAALARGWLDRDRESECFVLHDYHQHCPRTIKSAIAKRIEKRSRDAENSATGEQKPHLSAENSTTGERKHDLSDPSRARVLNPRIPETKNIREDNTPLPPTGGTTPASPDSLPGVEAPDPAQPTRFATEVRDAWNEMAREAGLPLCRDLTRDRQRKIAARSREHFWRDNWRAALAALPRDDFRCGREAGKTWKADIDYFLRPDSVAKILEKAGAEKPKLIYGMTLADLADIPENSFRRRPKEEPK